MLSRVFETNEVTFPRSQTEGLAAHFAWGSSASWWCFMRDQNQTATCHGTEFPARECVTKPPASSFGIFFLVLPRLALVAHSWMMGAVS
jgi:hypothetical protein